MTTKTTTARRRAFDWRKWGYETYAANAQHLMRMAEIADTIALEDREHFSMIAHETFHLAEGALVGHSGELSRAAEARIDAIHPAYVRCLFEA